MHFTVLRMISTGSLSAFSASAMNGAGGIVQKVQATTTAAEATPSVSTPRTPGKTSTPSQMPAKILPRGSLLNLSV
jgi:hypothetical protein